MPREPQSDLTWSQLTPAQKGELIYEYARIHEPEVAKIYEQQGLTPEQLYSSPTLWPVPVTSSGKDASELVNKGDYDGAFGEAYMGELRTSGSPLMQQYDQSYYDTGTVMGAEPSAPTGIMGSVIAGLSDRIGAGVNPQQTQQPQAGNTMTPQSPTPITYTSRNPGLSYDPNRGLKQQDFENYTGVRPGSSIDLGQYARTEQEQENYNAALEYLNQIGEQDINRFSVDPGDLQAVDAFTYDPALAAVYGVDPSMSFDETRAQLDYANALNAYAAQVDGTYLGEAAALQAAAARGESPLFADARLQRDAERMFQQQMMAAARARGSSSAGLAARQAMNNSMFGLGQLTNDANAARVQEMNLARDAYAQTGNVIRQGDIAAAGQAKDIGQLIYGINNAELGADMFNVDAMNRGSLSDQSAQNDAAQFNVGQQAAASAANAELVYNTLQGNTDRAMGTEDRDRRLTLDYTNLVNDMDEAEVGRRILAEQNFDESTRNAAAVLGNVYTGNATNQTQLTAQREASKGQRDASAIGAVGTVAGAIGTALVSDERTKDVGRSVKPADFSDIDERHWMYNENAPPHLRGIKANGGMADEYPDDVIVNGPGGYKAIDQNRLLMRLAGAVGDLQRRARA